MLVSSKKITFVEKFLKFKDAFVHSIMNNFVDISSIFLLKNFENFDNKKIVDAKIEFECVSDTRLYKLYAAVMFDYTRNESYAAGLHLRLKRNVRCDSLNCGSRHCGSKKLLASRLSYKFAISPCIPYTYICILYIYIYTHIYIHMHV